MAGVLAVVVDIMFPGEGGSVWLPICPVVGSEVVYIVGCGSGTVCGRAMETAMRAQITTAFILAMIRRVVIYWMSAIAVMYEFISLYEQYWSWGLTDKKRSVSYCHLTILFAMLGWEYKKKIHLTASILWHCCFGIFRYKNLTLLNYSPIDYLNISEVNSVVSALV